MRLSRLLIAEDNAELRRVLMLNLKAEGYAVRAAANGAQALELQRSEPADVLITDLFMPDSDGFEVIESFRRQYPETRIVAMSGEGQLVKQEQLSAAELIGVDATLAKPFQFEDLLRKLDELK